MVFKLHSKAFILKKIISVVPPKGTCYKMHRWERWEPMTSGLWGMCSTAVLRTQKYRNDSDSFFLILSNFSLSQECLQKWIKSSDIKRCELCKYPFAMQSKVRKSEKLFPGACTIALWKAFTAQSLQKQ